MAQHAVNDNLIDDFFAQDAAAGNLPAVTWLVSQGSASDHAPWSICEGENWLVKQINAVMNGPLWNSTAIVLTWDDFGGFYDHVPPPSCGSLRLRAARSHDRHLSLRQVVHRVVIFGAGVGMPYFSTDTAGAQRALEIGCDVLLMGKNGVDGVYEADPRKDPTARRFDQISYDEVLRRGLDFADATAISLCRDNAMPIVVFELAEGNIGEVVRGGPLGTRVRNGPTTTAPGKDRP